MKVLILGAGGMLGHRLALDLTKRANFEVWATVRSSNTELMSSNGISAERLIGSVDVSNLPALRTIFERVKPDVLINCIGIVKQRAEARQAIPSIRINSLLPHELCEICSEAGCRLVHFSTDCVFSGDKGNYQEDDFADANDLYGRTKYIGEVDDPSAITLRTSIIGPEISAAPTGLFEWVNANRGKRIAGFKNAIYSGITTTEMTNVIMMILLEYPELSGVHQVVSRPISKYELIMLINQKLNLGIDVREDTDFFCDRSMSGDKFYKITGYQSPSWTNMIDRLKENLIGEKIYSGRYVIDGVS